MKKQKVVKAWIEIFSIKNTKPDILWKLPTKSEIKIIKEYGGKIYPCSIIYQPL